jgi:hypothetical protein
MCDATVAVVHSTAPFPVSVPSHTTFHGRLAAYGNNSLWDNLSVDGDGEWIHEGIMSGSLCIAHDGLYMAKELYSLCSAGVIARMCDCLEGIEPCECKGKGHQFQRLGW